MPIGARSSATSTMASSNTSSPSPSICDAWPGWWTVIRPPRKRCSTRWRPNVQEALEEAAALAQRVYPPLLEARGFASALRSAAESAGVTVVVDVQAGARYPPEITAAVYWSCVEALSSASRGSQAAVSVLDADGALTFEVVVAGPPP